MEKEKTTNHLFSNIVQHLSKTTMNCRVSHHFIEAKRKAESNTDTHCEQTGARKQLK